MLCLVVRTRTGPAAIEGIGVQTGSWNPRQALHRSFNEPRIYPLTSTFDEWTILDSNQRPLPCEVVQACSRDLRNACNLPLTWDFSCPALTLIYPLAPTFRVLAGS